jgi:hypothetical protein
MDQEHNMPLSSDVSGTQNPYAVPHAQPSESTAATAVVDAPRQPAFTRAHVRVFVGLLTLASIATFLITVRGLDDGVGKWQTVTTTTLMTISGPLTGAVSRDLQHCCLTYSVSLLPWCLPPMIAAFALQQFWRPQSRIGEGVRVAAWGLGWAGWFFAGFVSFAHALS